MVYCGVPSKACAECRTRRTKCDSVRPSCSQCIRKGRKCNGYRDPVAALFCDESKGFATKRQRLTGPKRRTSTASPKSSPSLGIDKALAACSMMFDTYSHSDSSQSRGTSLLFEQVDHTLERSPPVESQASCFLNSTFTTDESDMVYDNLRFMSNRYACEETEEALVDRLTFMNYCDGADSMINLPPRYDKACIGRWWTADQEHEGFFGKYCKLGTPYTDWRNSSTVEPQFLDLQQRTKQLISNGSASIWDTNIWTPLSAPYLNVSMEVQAPCYFFSNYVLENTSYAEGFLDYLPSLCEDYSADSFLLQAVTALGSFGLGMKRRDFSALNSAQHNYSSALSQLNAALTRKEVALTDQVMTTVFLLGLYETNTCSTPRNLRAWTKHIKGAIAMLQLRGKGQLESSVGRQIFLQWRSQIVTYSLHRRSAVPEFMIEWSQDLLQHESLDESMTTSLFIITAKICDLRADMKYFRNYSKSGSIVPWALAIDAELLEWAGKCPASHKYTTVTPSEASEFVYEDYFHVYSSITVATVWNDYRRMRNLCHELLVQHVPYIIKHRAEYPDLDFSMKELKCQLYDSTEKIDCIAREICASVPYHFGLHLEDTNLKPGVLAPKAVCGNLLLRPLYMAGEPRSVSDHMRKWVIGRYEKIAELMGIKMAASLAHLLRIGVDPDQWALTGQE